jgi:periplasmic divalent cation tolerance protein
LISCDNHTIVYVVGPEIALPFGYKERLAGIIAGRKGYLPIMARPLLKKSAEQVLVILVTTENQEEAVRIGEGMVNAKLAACANIISGIHSIYRWKGKVVKAEEVLLLLKSTKSRYRALEKAIRAIHTYETPEIIALPVKEGLDQYIGWVQSETHS